MDVEASHSAEILKRRKRADTEHAADKSRLKRHCSNQHLDSGAEFHVALVQSDGGVYQHDTGSSESSPSLENGQRLPLHPGPDNVASGSTRVHTDDGSVEAGDVQGSGSVAHKSLAYSNHPPISTLQRSLYCQQPSGFRYATRCDGQQDQRKFLSLTREDLEDEGPCSEDPEVLEPIGSKSEFDLVVDHQGRGVGKSLGSLLSPKQENGPSIHEEVATQAPAPAPASASAQTQAQAQEGPSLNLDSIPTTSGPDFPKTGHFPTLRYRRPRVGSCCRVAQDFQDEDSDDDASASNVLVGNIDVDHDFKYHHGFCEGTVITHSTEPYPFVAIAGRSSDDRSEGINSGDDNANGEFGKIGQIDSDESTAEAADDQDHAEAESIEVSQEEATNSQTLSQLLGATTLGDSDSEGYASDNYANNTSAPPPPEQNSYSSPEAPPYSDIDTLSQDSSSEVDSFYEDSDYEAYSQSHSEDEMDDEEAEYLSDLCEFDDDTAGPKASSALTPPMTTSGRRRLTTEERELVRQTREIGACVRCRFQKIKCVPDHKNPEGKCKTCKRFSKTSPKTIHRVPCLRLRITEIVLYRSGGLNLTRRWKGVEMRDISERLGMSSIMIEVSQDFCKKPMFMEVVQFVPRDGDVTARYWTECLSGKATLKKKELATYCLKNIYTTAEYVRRYTVENALPAFLHTIQLETASGREGEPVFRTYYAALRRYMTLSKEKRSGNPLSQDDEREVEIFGNLFVLWCAIQHTVGSLYIQGDETLGMLPETQDKSYPLYGKVSAPRMIVAQFDNLVYNGVLETSKEKLLRDVDWLFSQDKSRWWFTIYIVIFILLREVSRMTADRYRHARDNFGPKPRYSIPAFVESLHESCNNILTHWHYYNCNKWPSNKDENDAEHFASLAPDDLVLVKQTRRDKGIKEHLSIWKQCKANNGKVNGSIPRKDAEAIGYMGSQDKFDWDHPLYWVAQMFEKNWYPHPTYQREPVPKNPFPTPVSTPR